MFYRHREIVGISNTVSFFIEIPKYRSKKSQISNTEKPYDPHKNNINQQITEQSRYQSHSKIVNRASASTRDQGNQNKNIEVIKVIQFIARKMVV